ncbi:MAG: SpoIIE family protein phosphatase [Deltaproteobacteria bacterium]|nr:SpoIIE family protein phosphatase [Deltaproteobacteria bacterium]
MATLPPVHLGVSILATFLIALALRKALQRIFVLSHPATVQPIRQFFFDLSLYVTVALMVGIFNHLSYRFPFVSGLSFLVGCLVVGFFLALDMSLARERTIINEALECRISLPPPVKLYSITRKLALIAFMVTLFVSVIFTLVISRDIIWLAKVGQQGISLSQAQHSVMYEVFFIMGVVLLLVFNLIYSYSKNLKLLFDNETNVLERVSQGDLSTLVPVATSDEFGLIAGHTNNMINGLRHRTELMTALKVAEEVQQKLLPSGPPKHDQLDVAGASQYCDETGGDYYDYLELSPGRLGVVVADVSGHGIPSALLMTTARALLRQRAAMAGDSAHIIADINWQLAKDVEDTGNFVTLFYSEFDMDARQLHWVRAGHDPAIVYEPKTDHFSELDGPGMALGLVGDYPYAESQRDIQPGEIYLIGTDGIWETRNPEGLMYGKERVRQLIRAHSRSSASEILAAIMTDLENYRDSGKQEDDVTLVVVRIVP